MKVSFRQGIIKHQSPSFLEVHPTSVSLLASTAPLYVTIAFGTKNLLHSELSDVPNAWTDIVPDSDQWLYIDLDVRTGARTFGVTSPEPIISTVEPLDPTQNQHWFDLTSSQMKVWDVNVWVRKIRIVVCLLENGVLPVSLSDNLTVFSGTQIGDYTNNDSGVIIYDNTTRFPIKDSRGDFITSSDLLLTSVTDLSPVKFESMILQGVADTNIPKDTVVRLVDYGVVRPANEYTASSNTMFGLVQDDVIQGGIATLFTRGFVSDESWDWSIYPVNTPLYVDSQGKLTSTKIIDSQVPVASVISPQSLMIGIPQTTVYAVSNPPMTINTLGIGTISVPPVLSGQPIVVGDNDPRLTDSRYPITHAHPMSDVTGLQLALNNKLDLVGGTITGSLSVNPPTQPSNAATKQYVDDVRITDLSDTNISNITTNDIIKFNGTSWVNTPLPASTISLQGDINGTGTTAAPVATSLTNVMTAGMYTKVKVDSKGRVIDSATLSSSDIPSLDWTKLTTGKPTSIAGYGITDGYTKSETNLLNWNWSHITSTPSTLAGYGIGNAVANAAGTPSIYQDAASNRPNGVVGQLFVDSTNNKIQRYSGSDWVDLSGKTITLSGDVSGTGTTSIAVTLGTVPISKGGTGQITATAALNVLLPTQSNNSGKVLSTDGTQPNWVDFPTQNVTSVNGQTGVVNINSIIGNAGTATILQNVRTVSLTGDVSGSVGFNGASDASISSTLASINPNIGTFGSSTHVGIFTVNNKGLITAASTSAITVDWSIITSKPTTLAGYGITDAISINDISFDWSIITSKPTTLAGYGITDAASISGSSSQDFGVKSLTVTGDILPSTTGIYNIGSPTLRFSTMYVNDVVLSTNTLYLGDTPILGTSGQTINIHADPNQSIDLRTSGTGSTVIESSKSVTVTTSGINANVMINATGIGSNVQIGATNEVQISGTAVNLSAPVTATSMTVNNNLTVTGNLIVNGTTSTVNSTVVQVHDNIITLNHGEVGSGVTAGLSGFQIDRGDVSEYQIVFDESDDMFKVGVVGGLEIISTRQWTTTNFSSTSHNHSIDALSNVALVSKQPNDYLTWNGSNWTNSALNADLIAIASLSGTSGWLKKTGAGAWNLDTSTYLTSNQSITLTGDVSGTGTTSIAVTLGTVPISKGGTGQTTAASAFDALAPSQTGNSGKVLTTNGTTTSWTTATGGSSTLDGLTDVTITTATTNEILKFNGTNWVNAVESSSYTLPIASDTILGGIKVGANLSIDGNGVLSAPSSGSGTVTSVGATGSTGLTIGNSPITTSGTISLTLDSSLQNLVGLGSSGFITKTGANTYGLDTSTYLTSNQSITISGDITGSGTTSIAVTLGTVPVSKGGTGQTTAAAAFNALVPSQTGNSGKVLTTNGTTTTWTTVSSGGGAAVLDDLTDVTITTATTNELLKFDGTKWVNAAESSGSHRVKTVSYSPTVSLNWVDTDVIEITLTGNITITNQTAWYNGQRCLLKIIQDAVGGRIVTFTSETITGTVNITSSAAINNTDYIGMIYNSTTGKFNILGFAGGY